MRAHRVGRVTALAGLLGAGGLVGLTAPLAPVASAVTVADPTPVCADNVCTVTFGEVGQPQFFTVPGGLTSFGALLTGGNGWGAVLASATQENVNYGLGAIVSAAGVHTTPGEKYEINVGGGGKGPFGGYNGGGNSYKSSGGGGGATDLRAPDSSGNYPVGTRILVAGGGGGTDAAAFQVGGKAGQAGIGGAGGANNSGAAGGAGTDTGAGLGGLGANGDTSGADGGNGMGAGAQGSGGVAGGSSSSVDSAGGGGGGYWGGGGGGGGGVTGMNPSSGGGGGGGSNHIGSVADGIQGFASVSGYNHNVRSSKDDGADGALVIMYDDPAPRLNSLSPTSGSSGGGTTVTLTGSGFTGATQVLFGTAPASSFTVLDDTTITAVTPSQAAGKVEVSVTGVGGTNEDVAGDGYTFVTPVASSVSVAASPSSVVADGSSSSVITASVKDQFGGLFAGPGVKLTASDATAKIGAVTDSGGTHTALYTAGTTVGAVTVTATTTSGTALTGMTTVTQTAKASLTPSPTPSSSPTPVVVPAAITLTPSAVFVPIGTDVAYVGKLTRAGAPVAGASVVVTETYVDGKTVNLGATTTLADGSYRLTSHPLYIGTITASSQGASASAPSRVIVTYRAATAKLSGGRVKVHAETRPGFIASANRQERAQILLVDASGKQLKVLGVVNAAQRKLFPGEAQGTNAIDATVTLPAGKYHVEVKVIGTPVNTGAPTKPIAITVS